MVTTSLLYALLLHVHWLAAGPFLWLIGRLFLPAPGAAAFTACALFTPATLLFTPGKDPAQLLSAAAPLWLWLWAVRRDRIAPAALAGVLFLLSCLLSLVHVWVACAALGASLLAPQTMTRRRMLAHVAAALGGGAACILLLRLGCHYDFFAATLAVARAQAGVTRGPAAMPWIWQALGAPLFLLLAGAALWSTAVWRSREPAPCRGARFGMALAGGASVILLATVGFTNIEAPRLWIPFGPLLLLGLAAGLDVFHRSDERAIRVLAMLVVIQVAAAALQWALLDPRESETRTLMAPDAPPRFFE
jgi:hypothetical protein